MRKKTQISLGMLLISLSIVLLINLAAMGQQLMPGTVEISRQTPLVAQDSCEDRVKVLTERLDKALDAFEKANAVISGKDAQIAVMKQLDGLKNELLAAKDQYIADVLADNKFLRDANKPTIKSKVRQFFEVVEKILLVGAGVYLGRL